MGAGPFLRHQNHRMSRAGRVPQGPWSAAPGLPSTTPGVTPRAWCHVSKCLSTPDRLTSHSFFSSTTFTSALNGTSHLEDAQVPTETLSLSCTPLHCQFCSFWCKPGTEFEAPWRCAMPGGLKCQGFLGWARGQGGLPAACNTFCGTIQCFSTRKKPQHTPSMIYTLVESV